MPGVQQQGVMCAACSMCTSHWPWLQDDNMVPLEKSKIRGIVNTRRQALSVSMRLQLGFVHACLMNTSLVPNPSVV